MKKLWIPLLLLFLVCQASAQKTELLGKVAPEITLKNLEGEAQSLSDFRGKVVLLEFWAGWCGPCIKDIKEWLKPMYAEYKDKGFEVFAVNYDRSQVAWEKSTERFGIPWPQVTDYKTASAYEDYGVQVIPTNYLLDKDGKIVAINIKKTKLSRKLDQLLVD